MSSYTHKIECDPYCVIFQQRGFGWTPELHIAPPLNVTTCMDVCILAWYWRTHCVLLQIKKPPGTYAVILSNMSIPGWSTMHRITCFTSVSRPITITTLRSRFFKTTSSSSILHRLGCPIFCYLRCESKVNSNDETSVWLGGMARKSNAENSSSSVGTAELAKIRSHTKSKVFRKSNKCKNLKHCMSFLLFFNNGNDWHVVVVGGNLTACTCPK